MIANETSNKMGLNNVAMIMAPNLFFQNNAKINKNEAKKAAGMTDVLRMLIKYQLIVWTVCFLATFCLICQNHLFSISFLLLLAALYQSCTSRLSLMLLPVRQLSG